jgi:hypothetical protein
MDLFRRKKSDLLTNSVLTDDDFLKKTTYDQHYESGWGSDDAEDDVEDFDDIDDDMEDSSAKRKNGSANSTTSSSTIKTAAINKNNNKLDGIAEASVPSPAKDERAYNMLKMDFQARLKGTYGVGGNTFGPKTNLSSLITPLVAVAPFKNAAKTSSIDMSEEKLMEAIVQKK